MEALDKCVDLVIERIAVSELVRLSARQKALLRYVVGEELAGRGDRIKAYAIATEVLGRPRNFDPESDSIVRTEMGRLRRALSIYNAAPKESDDPVRIVLESGSYQPRFERLDDKAKGAARADAKSAAGRAAESLRAGPARRGSWRRWLPWGFAAASLLVALGFAYHLAMHRAGTPEPDERAEAPPLSDAATARPTILLKPFVAVGNDPTLQKLSQAATEKTLTALTAHSWIQVEIAQAEKTFARANPFRTVIEGSIARGSFAVEAFVRAYQEGDTRIEWSRRFDAAYAGDAIEDAVRSVAIEIGNRLGAPYGALTEIYQARLPRSPALATSPTGCMIQAYGHLRDFSPERHVEVARCLDRSLADAPDSAELLAAKAFSLLEEKEVRLLSDEKVAANRDRAIELALKAQENNPFSALAQAAVLAAKRYNGQESAFRAEAERVLATHPNDPVVRLVYALRFAREFDRWDSAALIAAESVPTDSYWLLLIERAINIGAFDEARALCARFEHSRLPSMVLLRLATHGMVPDWPQVERDIKALAGLGFRTREDIARLLDQVRMGAVARTRVADGIALAFGGRLN